MLVLCIDLDSVGCGICDSCQRCSTSFRVSASLSLRADETEEHTGSIINGESHFNFRFKCRLSFCHQTKVYGWLRSPLVTLDTLPSSSSLHRWRLCIILTCTRAYAPSTTYVPDPLESPCTSGTLQSQTCQRLPSPNYKLILQITAKFGAATHL